MLARSIIRLCQRRVYVHIGLIEGSATCLFAVRDFINFVCACALADEFGYLHMRIKTKCVLNSGVSLYCIILI